MSLWANPFYHLELSGRGPQRPNDLRGWLLGRGLLALLWRLLPLSAVMACIALARVPVANAQAQALGQLAAWLSPLALGGIAVLVGAAVTTARDWRQGRMDEWRVTPAERKALVGGKAWGRALPLAAALTAGSLPAAAGWLLARRAGWGTPPFVPLEGVLLLLEAWAALFLLAHVGQWAGHQAERVPVALGLALAVGVALLAAVGGGIFLSLDLARLGGHLMVIGGAWLAGSFFQGWCERKVR
ncbi:MAG: hypothetical protein HY321_17195 [Armatimonadetes bacterium]|nr:hypothetical protein [Armatimonadota bacterium]